MKDVWQEWPFISIGLSGGVVRIDKDDNVSIITKNGSTTFSSPITEIFGINHLPVGRGLLGSGVFAFCTSYEDTRLVTPSSIQLLPGAVVFAKRDQDKVGEILAWFEERRSSSASKESPFELEAISQGSYLALQGNAVIIRHTGFLTQMAKGGFQGEKRIPLKSILSVQFKKADDIAAGYLQFETAGGSQLAARGGVFEGAGDENTVLFSSSEQPAFEVFRDRINNLISADVTHPGSISSADELEKFAKLRDQGIITEDEFNQKKKKILGL